MSYVADYQITKESLRTVFEPGNFVMILEEATEVEKDIHFFFKTTTQLKNKNFCSIISSKSPSIPFLTIKETIFLGLSNKQRQTNQKELNRWLQFLQLDSEILNHHFEELSFQKTITFQLIRALVHKKDVIILDDIFDSLPLQMTQRLLPLMQKIAKDNKIVIIALTSNSEIAHCSFADRVIMLLNQ